MAAGGPGGHRIAGGANALALPQSPHWGGNPPTAMQFNTGKQFDYLVETNCSPTWRA